MKVRNKSVWKPFMGTSTDVRYSRLLLNRDELQFIGWHLAVNLMGEA